MKNIETFLHIEGRSFNYTSSDVKIQAAFYTWLGNRGHESLLAICEEIKVSYCDVVDFAVDIIKRDYPEIKFPRKRTAKTPEFDYHAMARMESACYNDPENSPTFELFYYLANP